MPYTLVSAELCPYVERCRILLAEKALSYESKFVDLRAKPDWFLAMSPRGRVPLLIVGDEVVFESSVINELLEELHPEPRLFPTEPVGRARARSWIVFVNDEVMPAFAQLWFKPAEEAAARAQLKVVFGKLEESLAARPRGPFFLGERFSLVDASIAPIWNRLAGTEQLGYRDLLDGFPRLATYVRELIQHPSVVTGRFPALTERFVAAMQARRAAR